MILVLGTGRCGTSEIDCYDIDKESKVKAWLTTKSK